ncbi:MAG: endo alpha-1,4 polygalactosaminidase [Solirubrobacteraceae bacterium]
MLARAAAGLLLTAAAIAGGPPAAARVATTRIWHPRPGTTWQWQISGRVDERPRVAMYDVDLFDARPGQINGGMVGRLHRRGIAVVCYVDTGAWESYRPDARRFPRSVIGRRTYASDGTPWAGERWLDIRRRSWPRFAPIIWRRFDLARRLGCDGVEPDQNNPLGNHPGFPITHVDQKRWYLEVALQAHRRGLSVGQKNGIETTDADIVRAFDWNLNEECFQYRECSVLRPYVAAGKAVFQVEYRGAARHICPRARRLGFSTLLKRPSLGAWRVAC